MIITKINEKYYNLLFLRMKIIIIIINQKLIKIC